MALFGRRTAVVPLGISCQTAYQLERAQCLIAELRDEIFQVETTPFDWRIVGPGDIADMLATNNPYPAIAAELVGTKRPYWPRRRCHFWHDPAGNFAAFTEKQAHLWANWAKISRAERKIFILSNCQGNLPDKAIDPGGFDWRINAAEIVRLAVVLSGLFERPELHVVARKADFDGLENLPQLASCLNLVRLGVHFVTPREANWQGDDMAWNGALAAIIGRS